MGLRGPRAEASQPKRRPRRWRVTPALLDAWRARDQAKIRALLGLDPWMDGPWVTHCRATKHGEGHGDCACAVVALRARILAALEPDRTEATP